MATEIERKFLIKDTSILNNLNGTLFIQAYLVNQKNKSIRVRITDNKAWLNIKGETKGVSRQEFEYKIPLSEAKVILDNFCNKPYIIKKRFIIPHGELFWEVDVFEKENEGLIVAEIELPDENYPLAVPDWIGKEISHDVKYYNANLIHKPFKEWKGE